MQATISAAEPSTREPALPKAFRAVALSCNSVTRSRGRQSSCYLRLTFHHHAGRSDPRGLPWRPISEGRTVVSGSEFARIAGGAGRAHGSSAADGRGRLPADAGPRYRQLPVGSAPREDVR